MIRKFWMLAITMIALFSFTGQAGAQIAVPTAPVVSFTTPEQVTNPPSPTGPLTASFSVSGYTGSFIPVPVLHYGINFSLDPTTPIFCAGGVGVENCTVKIYFNPTLPGALKDALFLMNPNTGTRMASVLLGGIGLKSLALIQPGLVTNAAPTNSEINYMYNSAIDDNGVAYVINYGSSPATNVWSVKGGVMTPIPITFTGLNGNAGPRTIAIDGAGVLYFTVGDYRTSLVTYDTVAQTAGTFSTIPTGYKSCTENDDGSPQQYLDSVVLDQLGNIFVLEDECEQVIEIKPDGSYIVTDVTAPSVLPSVVGVDANDNIFLTGYITEEAVPGSPLSIIYNGINNGYPEAIAIDAADTLYLTRWPYPATGHGSVGELAASNYNATLAWIDNGVNNAGSAPLGLGLATDGTVYAGNYSTLEKVDRSQGAINFGEVTFNTPSTPQVVGVYNGGNENLTVDTITLTQPTGWTDFSIAPTAANPCSLTGTTLLLPGQLCNVQVTLTTQHGGNLTGTVTFTTDEPSLQTVSLSGYNYGPDFTASPASLVFGYVAPGGSVSLPVTLTNDSLIYSAYMSLTPVSAPAGISVSTAPGQTSCYTNWIAPLVGTCAMTVTYAPGPTPAISNGNLILDQYTSPYYPYLFTLPITATSVTTATITLVKSSLKPSTYGQSVTFTGMVQPITGSGHLQFSLDGIPVGTNWDLKSSTPTYITSALTAGSHAIGAAYTPLSTSGWAASSTTPPLTQVVNPAPLTVTAVNISKIVGTPNPTFTASYTGFVNGETAAVLGGAPSFNTIPANPSAVGTYPITVDVSGLTDANYTYTPVNGTLTVVAAPTIVLTWTAPVSGSASTGYTATVTVTNNGTGPALSATLSNPTLNSIPGTPVSQSLGTLAAGGGSVTVTVNFPGSAGANGATVKETIPLTYTGGTAGGSAHVILP
jgi:hypothetical protein